jgi:predicted metal-binding protein
MKVFREGIESRWTATILVCGKCTKKIGGGFGDKGKTPLAKALRKRAGKGWGRKAPYGVIETKCLGICPRDAVVLIDAAHPGKWIAVREGTPVDEVAARLGLPPAVVRG